MLRVVLTGLHRTTVYDSHVAASPHHRPGLSCPNGPKRGAYDCPVELPTSVAAWHPRALELLPGMLLEQVLVADGFSLSPLNPPP